MKSMGRASTLTMTVDWPDLRPGFPEIPELSETLQRIAFDNRAGGHPANPIYRIT
jgi:hypothetical protein